MAFMMRESSGRTMAEASCTNIVRRMVSLPRSILGGVSRVVDQGMDLVRAGGRRNQHHLPPNFHQFQHPHDRFLMNVEEEWAFLTCFEQQYGTAHPFFYACRFMQVVKMAQDEHKFVFIYLHSPDHPFTLSFCRETLCSELVVQFLDTNFVCWGAIANRGEGLYMAATLGPASFPFCAVVAPASASGDSLAVLQVVEGPVSPVGLVEILQRVMEEQRGRAKEEEKRRADRWLREEQDVAYLAALQINEENDKLKRLPPTARVELAANKVKNQIPNKKQTCKLVKEASTSTCKENQNQHAKDNAVIGNSQATTQILIRFPNGERREKRFLCGEKIQAIYEYIDSQGLAGAGGNYKLITSFPRKVYGVEEMGMSLKDAGLHPRATLFLDLIV